MKRIDCIAIGTSLGGINALRILFSALPADLSIPIVVVIHRAPTSNDSLVDMLQKYSKLVVQEGGDRLPLLPGTITLAPADYHLLIEEAHCALSLEGAVHYARPSIDVLFDSVADNYGPRALGILLTGGGVDGVMGLGRIARVGGQVLIENPETAFAPGLPEAALATGIVSEGMSLQEIANHLTNLAPPDPLHSA